MSSTGYLNVNKSKYVHVVNYWICSNTEQELPTMKWSNMKVNVDHNDKIIQIHNTINSINISGN